MDTCQARTAKTRPLTVPSGPARKTAAFLPSSPPSCSAPFLTLGNPRFRHPSLLCPRCEGYTEVGDRWSGHGPLLECQNGNPARLSHTCPAGANPSRCNPMRPIMLIGMIVLLAACSSPPETEDAPRVIVVDVRGSPIKGALVMPDSEDEGLTDPSKLTSRELNSRTSDAQGLIHADLRVYFWPSDGCFHFIATREGYEDTALSVSKDLFPLPLRIKMEAAGDRGKPKSTHNAPASPTN